jgi:hypothetical protein
MAVAADFMAVAADFTVVAADFMAGVPSAVQPASEAEADLVAAPGSAAELFAGAPDFAEGRFAADLAVVSVGDLAGSVADFVAAVVLAVGVGDGA